MFAATVNPTVPVPVPGLPPVIVTQSAFEDAVHAHDGSDAVTVTVSLAPSDPYDPPAEDSVNVHDGGGVDVPVSARIVASLCAVRARW